MLRWRLFGALNLAMSAWSLYGCAVGLPVLLGLPSDSPNVVIEYYAAHPGALVYVRGASVLGLVAAAIVFIAGAGLLSGRTWGVRLSRAWAWYALFALPTNLMFKLVVLLPVVLESFRKSSASAEALSGLIAGAVAGTAATCAYAILLLFLLRQPRSGSSSSTGAEVSARPAAGLRVSTGS